MVPNFAHWVETNNMRNDSLYGEIKDYLEKTQFSEYQSVPSPFDLKMPRRENLTEIEDVHR